MATLTCKHCGAAIPAESIGDGELAICNVCDALNNLSTEPIALPEKDKTKGKRSAPNRFRMQQLPDRVEIHYHWWNRSHWGQLGITVFMNLFVIFMFGISGFSALCFMLPFLLVGLGLLYSIVAGALNHTRIQIQQQGLDIIHHPLPTFTSRDQRIDRRAIEQVYCKRRVAYEINEKPVYVFDVRYVVKGGGDILLVSGLETHEEALFLEQYIENLYQIEDSEVDKNHEMMEQMRLMMEQYTSELQKRKNP